jgi:hypothetical protein
MNQLDTQVSIRLPVDIVDGIEQFRAANSTRHLAMDRSAAIRALLTLGLASMSEPEPQPHPDAESCPVPQAGPVPDTDGAVVLVYAADVGVDDDGRAVYLCRYWGKSPAAVQAVESALFGLYPYHSNAGRAWDFEVDYRMTAEEVRALGEDIAGALRRARAGVAS